MSRPTTDRAPDALALFMKDISRVPLLDRDEETRLAVRAKKGDAAARALLVTSNLRLVVKIAGQYRHYGLPFGEIVQEGNIGLIRGVDKFDPAFGTRLSTYVCYWIKAMIGMYVIRNWSLVKLGTTQEQRKLFFALRGVEAKLAAMGGGSDDDAVAAELNVKPSAVRSMRERMKRETSLDKPIDTDGGAEKLRLLDLLVDHAADPEAAADRGARIGLVSSMLKRELDGGAYDDRERYILEHRIMSDTPEPLAVIGEKFDLSRERIRQLETRLLRKLRDALTANGLGSDDGDTAFPTPPMRGVIPSKERSLQ